MVRCEPGDARFQQRAREVDGLGERELQGSAVTSSRVAAARPPGGELTRALAELGQVASRLANHEGDAAALRGRVQALVPLLAEGRRRLEIASAELGQEERALSVQAEGLRHHAYLAQEIDRAVEAALPGLAEPHAAAVRGEVLFPVRQRRQQLLVQLAVVTQALAVIRLTLSNNRSVINSVQVATSSALAAASMPPLQ